MVCNSTRILVFLLVLCCCSVSAEQKVSVEQLIDAAQRLELHTLRQLLDKDGGSINQIGPNGDSPLSAAILSKAEVAPEIQRDVVRFLLQKGADPDLRTGDIAPLELAMLKDVEMVKILLKAGADPLSEAQDGLTPLGTASGLDGEKAEEIRALLQAEVDKRK